ncbi:hypothetical protein BpHYR1_003856 [Brachionus plicatilis]|uniref:Uncharacterized protein n=1 Tax=Brachionus plicatilis TaxID=10195 RepID=A0A3M7P9Y5_BRAPC|nr:hypothetical protein BpHYR1_003856 [Brachionus plicatilis]
MRLRDLNKKIMSVNTELAKEELILFFFVQVGCIRIPRVSTKYNRERERERERKVIVQVNKELKSIRQFAFLIWELYNFEENEDGIPYNFLKTNLKRPVKNYTNTLKNK